jgi:prepilin-type N-terminal cleavage/methylation domain-containing protein
MTRGYTVVELMMALAVLAVSVTGVMAMQKVTAVSNANARDVAVANRVAQTWVEQLRADARLWNHPSPNNTVSDIGDTAWLKEVDNDEFTRPTWNDARQIGAAFDGLGRPYNQEGADAPAPVFCAEFFLTPLTPAEDTRGEIRATVRVYWLRQSTPRDPVDDFCRETAGRTPDDVGNQANLADYHFVYHTTVVRQWTAQ